MLHRAGVEFCANRAEHGGARIAVVARHAYFDEFVAFEMHVDFAQHGGCHARITDNNHGFKMMRTHFKVAALRGGQLSGFRISHARSVPQKMQGIITVSNA